MEALAAVSAFSSSSSLSSTAPRPHHRLLTSPASGRSTRTLLPPPRDVSSSRAPLVVSHPPPVAAAHTKVDHSGRFCIPRSARELALLCKGSELLDRILARGGKYSEEDAKVVMVRIFSVVSFCHLQGVVHRDLKPENFLFTSKDETSALKVIDFGLSDFVKPGIFRAVLKAEPSFDEAPWPTLTAEAKDFVKMLLNKDYRKRMTAAQALSHPWIRNAQQVKIPLDMIIYKLMRAYISSSSLRKSALRALVKNSTDAMKDARVVDFVNTYAVPLTLDCYGLRDTTPSYAVVFLNIIPLVTFILSLILRIPVLLMQVRSAIDPRLLWSPGYYAILRCRLSEYNFFGHLHSLPHFKICASYNLNGINSCTPMCKQY